MPSRRHFLAASAAALAGCRLPRGSAPSDRPTPSDAQLQWQRDEIAVFIHFGVNTFTNREWGDGTEDPRIFDPARLDARQWVRAAKGGGAKAVVLTAKHHDGFCLWPTSTTEHSVKRSPWRGGNGDVVRELADACRAEGLGLGLYCSPWDRNHPTYGDSPRYNEVFLAQLTELLTRYGPLQEVWFDGANGEGPNGKKQVYDWPRFWGHVKRLQPNAVIFSDAGPDVRWIGNERGIAGDPCWATVDPAVVPVPGVGGDAVIRMLQHGDPAGTVWRPGESDVSIRPGWFYHPAEDERVRTVDNLVNLYFSSVGRNSKLLLNVPPTRDGLLHDTDVARLAGMRERLTTMFRRDLMPDRKIELRRGADGAPALEVDFGRPTTLAIADLREDIRHGQRVARYTLEGSDGLGLWRTLSSGTTIGHRKLDRLDAVTVRQVRLRIEGSYGPPRVTLGLYA